MLCVLWGEKQFKNKRKSINIINDTWKSIVSTLSFRLFSWMEGFCFGFFLCPSPPLSLPLPPYLYMYKYLYLFLSIYLHKRLFFEWSDVGVFACLQMCAPIAMAMFLKERKHKHSFCVCAFHSLSIYISLAVMYNIHCIWAPSKGRFIYHFDLFSLSPFRARLFKYVIYSVLCLFCCIFSFISYMWKMYVCSCLCMCTYAYIRKECS